MCEIARYNRITATARPNMGICCFGVPISPSCGPSSPLRQILRSHAEGQDVSWHLLRIKDDMSEAFPEQPKEQAWRPDAGMCARAQNFTRFPASRPVRC
jgi:hypothetical protein